MAFNYLCEEELDRERLVRRVRCPVCGATRGKACRYSERFTSGRHIAHTGRYNAAATKGLVPALAGSHG